MKILDRLLGRTDAKASSVASAIFASVLGRPQWPDRPIAKLSLEGYRQNAVVFACIAKIAEAVAGLDYVLYDEDSAGKVKEIDTHPLLDLLNRPNATDDREKLIRDLVTHYLISGNLFAERVAGLGGKPVELYALRPDRITIIPGPDGYPVAYNYTVGQTVRRLETSTRAVLHLAEPNPLADWWGMSRLDPAGFAIDVYTGSGALQKALIENSARPSGAFVYKGESSLSAEQFERLRSEIGANYAGARNAGKPLLLDGALTWERIGMNLAEMEFVEGRRDAAREIALAFGVPPLILGIPGDNTFANYEEANKEFYRGCVMPMAARLARSLGAWLLPAFGPVGRMRLDYDEDDIPALAGERAAKWTAIATADFLTIDEKREALGYEALPSKGGEVLLVPSSMIPLDQAGEVPQGGPAPDLNAADDGEDL